MLGMGPRDSHTPGLTKLLRLALNSLLTEFSQAGISQWAFAVGSQEWDRPALTGLWQTSGQTHPTAGHYCALKNE